MTTKRVVRVAWVVAANGFVIWLMISRLRPFSEPAAPKAQFWFEMFVEVLLPVIGIVLEVFRWKSAKWINLGYPVLAGVFWLLAAAYWHSDPFFGVLLLIGVGMLVLAGLMVSVYKTTGALDRQQSKTIA